MRPRDRVNPNGPFAATIEVANSQKYVKTAPPATGAITAMRPASKTVVELRVRCSWVPRAHQGDRVAPVGSQCRMVDCRRHVGIVRNVALTEASAVFPAAAKARLGPR